MNDPIWLAIAKSDIGLKEIPGAPTEPRIAAWLKRLGAWWNDDGTPWCGVAMAAWMDSSNIPIPKHWYRARAWLDWGMTLGTPAVGCVVVFDGGRERPGAGHVGIVIGITMMGRLMVLGGNQGDAVSIKPFEMGRVLGYRWPTEYADMPRNRVLPLMASNGELSRNEA
jgi:uncharacterized protein (TIGR02594 family)